MTLALNVSGTNRITYLQDRSISARQASSGKSSLDFTLIDPPTLPALGNSVTLKDGAVTVWSGSVNSVQSDDFLTKQRYVKVGASNTTVATIVSASFGLSDDPDNSTTFGYTDLSVQLTTEDDGASTRASLVTYKSGFAAGNIVTVTNALHSWTDKEFSLNEIRTEYPVNGTPRYTLSLGDAKVKLSVWVQDQVDSAFPIDSTKITDGAVTTPKLAANAVTAVKIAAAAVSTTNLQASAVTADKIAAGAVDTTKLSVADALGANLVPNGTFALALPASSPTEQSGYLSVSRSNVDGGLSDEWGLNCQAQGPSVDCAYGTDWFDLVAGRTVTFSAWVRNPGSGTPTARLILRVGDAGGLVASYEVADFVPDGGPFARLVATVVIPAGITRGFLRLGMMTNPGVGAGFVSRIIYEDVQVEYGPVATAWKPSAVPGNVVIDGSGIAVINGKITVASDGGGTVIIDGSSQMFKIASSGTLSKAWPTSGFPAFAESTITLSALGSSYTTPPAALFMVTTKNSVTDWPRTQGVGFITASGNYVADAAGQVDLSSGTPRVHLALRATGAIGTTAGLRYYVLVEAGI